MCKLFGYCCSLLFYAVASIGLFALKLYTDCEGQWDGCDLSQCEKQYMWYDLWACMMLVGPVTSILSITHCGFTWWKFASLSVAVGISIAQILSICGCCFTRKRHKNKNGDDKKKKKKKGKNDEDDKTAPINTDIHV